MKCPICHEKLVEFDRSGVLVDFCPACKGVWLDRCEVDKVYDLLVQNRPEEASQPVPAISVASAGKDRNPDDDWKQHTEDHFYYGGRTYYGEHRKDCSWFMKIFELPEGN